MIIPQTVAELQLARANIPHTIERHRTHVPRPYTIIYFKTEQAAVEAEQLLNVEVKRHFENGWSFVIPD